MDIGYSLRFQVAQCRTEERRIPVQSITTSITKEMCHPARANAYKVPSRASNRHLEGFLGILNHDGRGVSFLQYQFRNALEGLMLKPGAILAFVLCANCFAFGQSARPTMTALYRTFMIQTPLERGTVFSVDIDNREYWITAKHLFTGIKTGPAGEFKPKHVVAALLAQSGEENQGLDQHWLSQTFSVIDPGKDIDILILAPNKALLPKELSLKPDSKGIGLGADCEFLGFPYGGGWKAHMDTGATVWLPYMKHCTVSAMLTDSGLKVWVLDGINNEGFSGGPVLFDTGANQQVFAVVSGFHPEPLDVLPAPELGTPHTGQMPPPPPLQGQTPKRQVVNANSGFIVAFDISAALDAIHNNPIGPTRDGQQ